MAEISFMQPIPDRSIHRVVVPLSALERDAEGLLVEVQKVNQVVWKGSGKPTPEIMATARETALNPPTEAVTEEFGGEIVALRGNIATQKRKAIKIGGRVVAEWWRTTSKVHATELDPDGYRINPSPTQ